LRSFVDASAQFMPECKPTEHARADDNHAAFSTNEKTLLVALLVVILPGARRQIIK
jgi:hypothetical protein